jgi:hypothetical protein
MATSEALFAQLQSLPGAVASEVHKVNAANVADLQGQPISALVIAGADEADVRAALATLPLLELKGHVICVWNLVGALGHYNSIRPILDSVTGCNLLAPEQSVVDVLSSCMPQSPAIPISKGVSIFGTNQVVIVSNVPGSTPIISERTPVLTSVTENLASEFKRPALGTVCPLGTACDITHYIQDCSRLRHFTDEEIMMLQHVCDFLINGDAEMFLEEADIERCTCTCDKKCNIKASHNDVYLCFTIYSLVYASKLWQPARSST